MTYKIFKIGFFGALTLLGAMMVTIILSKETFVYVGQYFVTAIFVMVMIAFVGAFVGDFTSYDKTVNKEEK
ncbi:MAG: hypothetical protein ABSB71_07980 [Candidatus Bathyarchaeia archaeon]|jgi:hypothetical protein